MAENDKPVAEMTDDELEARRLEVESEKARRQTLNGIPAAIADWARQYRDAGGVLDDLVSVVQNPDGDGRSA